MPLFGRRSRSLSVVRPTTPSTTSPAMLAASQAFMGSQTPPGKLATGAAAAALRSMSPASVPVGQVQTKRMMERNSSVGPTNGAQRGRSRGNQLARRSSSSSMTERTFRAESPARSTTSGGLPAQKRVEPPVPQVPETYADVPPIPPKSHRRSASIDDIRVRKAATLAQPTNRQSMTPPKAINPASVAARRVTSAQMSESLDRTDSNGSQNFSYPGRSRPLSPPPQTRRSQDGNTNSPQGISQTEARRIAQNLSQTAQAPVKKNKIRTGPLAEGSHLSTGTMGSKPIVTPLAPASPINQESPQSADRGLNNAKLSGQASHFPPSPVSPSDSRASDSESDLSQAKRSQRASGILNKQPSVVHENWEGEQDEYTPVSASSACIRMTPNKQRHAPPEANVSRKIEAGGPASQVSDPSEAISTKSALSTPKGRQPSLSPSRSARFSTRLSADMTEGQKHNPPARSISPRKSALKHSPQMLPIDSGRTRDVSASPSEGTEVSFDGGSRRKKNAHVKFDTVPSVVGIASDDSPISPQIVSPQNQKDKKWYNKSPTNRLILNEDSDDDAMKPRPQLPTFGSVRGGRKAENEDQRMVASASSSSSSLSAETRPTTMDTSISSDHALGNLINQQQTQKYDSSSPLPPQVTSVEGNGLNSDTESLYSQDERSNAVPSTISIYDQITMPSHTVEAPITTKQAESESFVPSIAVLPATPGTEDQPNFDDQWLVDVPGGFPGTAISTEETVKNSNPSTPSNAPRRSYDDGERHEPMPAIQEESDRDSVYSDAAEDLSDLEGDGFGSINAIVRSPVQSPAASPVVATYQEAQQKGLKDSDWATTGETWKENATTAKKAQLQPAAQIDEKPKLKGILQQPKRLSSQGYSGSPASTTSSVSTPIQTPTPATHTARNTGGFKKSMRNGAQGNIAPTMRGSGRGSSEPPKLRSSMRDSSAPASRTTPISAPVEARGAVQKRNIPPVAAPVRTLPPVNNDSDSESSFKRSRRSKSSDGKVNMRRSMRAGRPSSEVPIPNQPAPRPMSPDQRRPFSSAGGEMSMRSTLRGSRDDIPTMRGNQGSSKRSSSLFGRTKSPTPGLTGPKSRFAVDADDDKKSRRSTFKSRFADSSDEDEDMRPVRGIPRRQRDDDSTDLDDSSEDEARRRRNGAKKEYAVAAPSPQVSERPTSPMSIDGQKKKGLFGRFRKNKDDVSRPTSPAPVINGQQLFNGKSRNTESAALGFSSDAQKEALIEQTRLKLEAAKEGSSPQSQPQPSPRPMSPGGKLQRRVTPSRVVSDSWPLPPRIPEDTQTIDRPVTSDGSGVVRPSLGHRLTSSGTTATAATSPSQAYGRAGKKKRFPMLRKAFGLKD